MSRKKIEKLSLEEEYKEFFKPDPSSPVPIEENFEQPSLLKVVDTITTYGAYEDPV